MNIDDFLDRESENSEEFSAVLDLQLDGESQNVIQKPAVADTPVSFSEKFKSLESQIQLVLKEGSIEKAMDFYSDLVVLSKKIPSAKVDLKHKINLRLQKLHVDIQNRIKSYEDDFKKHYTLITNLVDKAKVSIDKKDLQSLTDLFKQALALYKALPNDFLDKKIVLYNKILHLDIEVNKLKGEALKKSFLKTSSEITALFSSIDVLIKQKQFDAAFKTYLKADDLFWSMSPGYLDEKISLYAQMLKYKNVIEISLQIKNLAEEIGTDDLDFNTTISPTTVDISVSKPVSSGSSLQKSTSETQSLHKDSVAQPNALSSNNVSQNMLNAGADSVKHTVADNTYLKLGIAKVRLELLEGNLEHAKSVYESLLQSYPESEELQQLHVDFEQQFHVSDDYKKKLLVAELDVEKRNDEKALEELIALSKDTSGYGEKKELFNASKDIASVVVKRRLDLAKRKMSQKDYAGAKESLERVLKIDKHNSHALSLLQALPDSVNGGSS